MPSHTKPTDADASPRVGSKLGPEWVYHNTWKRDLAAIQEEGLAGGSFVATPGFDFGRDAWIAVRRSDLRNPSEHEYGGAIAIEPQWGPGGVDKDFFKIETFHTIPAHRVVEVNKRGKVLRALADPPEKTEAPAPTLMPPDPSITAQADTGARHQEAR